ncbi:hypothetical protein O9H85_23350 [Paenibacillus filicis]|uniref:Uncharacterized protein n=1 Tax=Paenibacillus gyeongsangnamensis TaxID=3388067 RepID=A0ABT4QEM0_9BACL|nr:hypothetical protein [Paenibacillus filicis]MCZ8515294.1 hypothetical protein [Paenibacillus filicis]
MFFNIEMELRFVLKSMTKLIENYYFEDAFRWWEEYRDLGRISETEQQFITQDNGRWISLGLVVGEKQLG